MRKPICTVRINPEIEIPVTSVHQLEVYLYANRALIGTGFGKTDIALVTPLEKKILRVILRFVPISSS